MGQVLHGCATTTEAVRRAIQRSEESVRALAKRHGLSPTTVQKWRKRASVSDAPMARSKFRRRGWGFRLPSLLDQRKFSPPA